MQGGAQEDDLLLNLVAHPREDNAAEFLEVVCEHVRFLLSLALVSQLRAMVTEAREKAQESSPPCHSPF